METALIYGLVASSALVIGALAGLHWRIPKQVLAVLLAFAGGALIAALTYELFSESYDKGGVVIAGVGLLAGAAAFILVDYLLLERLRQRATGWALLAAATLDGVPENLALGVSIATGTAPVALLAGVFAANVPEALVGAAKMKSGRSGGWTLAIWVAVATLLAAAVLGGAVLLEDVSGPVNAVILAFAAGAVLASIADTMLPEAYRDGGPLVAFATVAGFFVSFLLNHL